MPTPPDRPGASGGSPKSGQAVAADGAGLSSYARFVSGLSQNAPTAIELVPTPDEAAQMAAMIGLSGLRKVSFRGEIRAEGKRDWTLKARLGATVVQPCVVSLEPVTTRIDVDVVRRFLSNWHGHDEPGSETEMPEDVSIDALGTHIDPWAVMVEEIALQVPDFPRADGAAIPGPTSVTEPGQAPLSDADVKPFAGLAALKAKLSGGDPPES